MNGPHGPHMPSQQAKAMTVQQAPQTQGAVITPADGLIAFPISFNSTDDVAVPNEGGAQTAHIKAPQAKGMITAVA
eukprot:CAMPEP_0179022724 /NCGR_PEP_ID=MMETSP0796-20121207/6559_1 /TAXON_ID=73915 /ORGANISM="Pyrodinium bahamense, Strain pbaha01" /LENGTH=75 /DNA_ID=CAMNT_0020718607 /DNA_START=490 /DNA_END=717 /DNA_ORIENTATION=+